MYRKLLAQIPTERTPHPAIDGSISVAMACGAYLDAIADLNITHFRRLLQIETDPVKRQTIEKLLAAEEAKLARALANKGETSSKT